MEDSKEILQEIFSVSYTIIICLFLVRNLWVTDVHDVLQSSLIIVDKRYWLYRKFGEKILKIKKDGSFLLHPKAPCFCPFSIPIHRRPNSITEVTKGASLFCIRQ